MNNKVNKLFILLILLILSIGAVCASEDVGDGLNDSDFSISETNANFSDNELSEGNSSDMGESDALIKNSLTASNLMEGATTWYVGENITSGGDGSEENPFNNLKLALNVAKENDTIKVNEGIYSGINNTGLSIGIKGLTIESNGGNVVFNGSNTRRAFSISSSNVCLNGLNFVDTKISSYGGAIYSSGDNTSIINCNFTNSVSTSNYGGAIYISGSNAKIANSTFNRTKSSSAGGAVYIFGENASVEGSSFYDSNSSNGGALYISGNNASLVDSEFDKVKSSYGAAYLAGWNGTVVNTRFNNTNSTSSAGSLYMSGSNSRVRNSTFNNSKSGNYGGAIYFNNENASVEGSSFNNVNASSSGGAIYFSGADSSIANSNFTDTNSNNYGGSVYFSGKNSSISASNFSNTHASYSGGSVYFNAVNSTVLDSTFNNSKSGSYGGAIYFNNGNSTVEGSSFNNVNASSSGGAIYFNSMNSKVAESNFSNTHTSYNGGSIYFSGRNSTVIDSTFNSSAADYGGSIYFYSANSTVTGSDFIDSHSTHSGGAIYSSSANATVRDSTFYNTSGSYGGALYLTGSNATVDNSKFSNNIGVKGGSIYLTGTNGTISNNEFSHSTADYGGSIYNGGTNLNLTGNSIESSVANIEGNYIYNNGTIKETVVVLVNNSTVVAEPHSAVNAKLEVTDDMGNPIYGGTVTVYNNGTRMGNYNVTDNTTVKLYPHLKGEVLLSGGNYSKGNCTNKTGVIVFEEDSLGPYYVSMDGSDDNDGSLDHPVRNIETAIYLASRDNVTHAVFINEGTYNEAGLLVNKSMNITGLGDVVINSNNTHKSIMGVSASNVNITNICFANGNATNGGALNVTGSYADISDCRFINNSATNGGAIHVRGYNSKVNDCTFDNNTATNGGTIYNSGSYTELSNNTITNSEASTGQYIYNNGSFANYNITVLKNSTITCPQGKNANVTVNVTDDMGHPIGGGEVSILLDSQTIARNVQVVEGQASALVNPSKTGENLASASGTGSYSVKTGVINFDGTPYTGPTYVSEDGSDENDGSIDHPVKNIHTGVQLASNTNSENSLYIKDGNYAENNLTVRTPLNITGLGDVTIDGENKNASIMNISASNVNVSNIKFVNGNATNGGAINWTGSYGHLDNSTFINNTATNGGAVYSSGQYTLISNSTFEGNNASSNGGAVYLAGSGSNLTDSEFSKNTADIGGSIYVGGSNSRVDNINASDDYSHHFGGSVAWYADNGVLNNANITNSDGGHMGGAVYWHTYKNGTIDNSSFQNNYAIAGGAVYWAGNGTLNNTKIFNNSAEYGGGMYWLGGNGTVMNTNVTHNQAYNDIGGIASNSTLKLVNVTDEHNTPNNLLNITDETMFVHTNSSAGSGYNNVLLSNGYHGYCINHNRAIPGDGNTMMITDMSIVINSLDGSEVGEFLKIMFYNYQSSVTQSRIWIFTDDDYRNSSDTIVKQVIADYDSGLRIPNHGAVKKLSDTKIRTYDFEGLLASYNRGQNLFAYKIQDQEIVYNMTLVKDALNKTIFHEGQTEFLLTVKNTGNYFLSEVFITEQQYDGLTYDSYIDENNTWTHSIVDGKHHWTYNGDLAANETASLLVIFNATQLGNFTNYAVGGSNQTNNTTANNTTVVHNAEIKVEKITLTPDVPVGRQTSFIIRVTNVGDCELDNVTVKEVKYDGLIFDHFTDNSKKWIFNKTSMTWDYNATLDPEASAEFTVFFNSTEPGNFTNIVYAGNNLTNDTANNTTEVHEAKVVVEKICLTPDVPVGRQTSFIIRVTNVGDCALDNITVKELSYEGLVYDSFINDEDENWEFDGTSVWTYKPMLGIDESAELTVIFNSTEPGNFTNIAFGGNDLTNDTVNNTTEVHDAKVVVEKICLTPDVPVGRQTSFIIRVSNVGDWDLDNVTVEELSYEGLVYDSFINDEDENWEFDGTSIWTYKATLAIGESAEFTVVFNTPEPGNFTNIIIGGNDLTDGSGNDTTEVHETKLKVEKITLTKKVAVGRQTSFLIRVTNIGDWDLENVWVKEFKYDGLVYDHYTDDSNDWEFDGTDKWTYKPVLAAGESAEFTVFFNTIKAGNFTNIVIAGSDLTNNTNETTSNTTEVFEEGNKTNNNTNNNTDNNSNKTNNNTDKDNSSNNSNVNYASLKNAGVNAGNPLFALLMALIVLYIPLRYRKFR